MVNQLVFISGKRVNLLLYFGEYILKAWLNSVLMFQYVCNSLQNLRSLSLSVPRTSYDIPDTKIIELIDSSFCSRMLLLIVYVTCKGIYRRDLSILQTYFSPSDQHARCQESVLHEQHRKTFVNEQQLLMLHSSDIQS